MSAPCVVGIDPSFTATACSVIQKGEKQPHDTEVFSAKTSSHLGIRIRNIRSIVDPAADWVASHKPNLVVLEGYSYGSKGASGIYLAELGGLLRDRLLGDGHTILEVPPKSLKRFVTGSGNATKIHLAATLARRIGVTYKTDDLYDALGLSLMGHYHLGWQQPNQDQSKVLERLEPASL